MAYYVTSGDTLTDLADAIREKGGTSAPLEFPDEFISAIGNITTGDNDVVFELVRDQTDTLLFVPTATYSEINAAITAGKSIGFYINASPGENLSAQYLSRNTSGGILYCTFEEKSIDLGGGEYYSSVIWTSAIIGSNDNIIVGGHYTHYQTVFATALPSHVKAGEVFFDENGYEEGTATVRSSSDLTVSGATVTAPAGYYESSASKAVASGSATTPATTITANPSISVNSSTGVITSTVSTSQSVTPTVSAGYVSSGTPGTVSVSGSNSESLSTQLGTTITPTESEQTAVAAGKYTLGAVKVAAISSDYVGSGITRRDETDLSASGATVTVPAGNYASQVTKSVASGSAGTPTATKGTVSNHSVTVTPSVTNTTGYITGSTKTGTAVTVSASELDSGTKSISANGTGIDVVGYAEVDVAVPSPSAGTEGTPVATKGTVSNHSVTVTPSVTNTAGVITGGTHTGTPVTVDVTELESGTKSITENGTGISVSGYSEVDVNVSGGGGDYPWFGPNTVKDYTKTITINLANDTSFDSWTASTTAKSILAEPTTNDFTYSFDRDSYEVCIVCTAITNFVLKSTATKKVIPISNGRIDWYVLFGYPNTYAQYKSLDVGGQAGKVIEGEKRLYSYDASGVRGVTTSSYGVYHYGAPTYSQSASGSTVTISGKRNAIYARCSGSYFATARKADIDSANTNVVITFDVYKTPRANAFIVHGLNDMFTAMNSAPEA